MPYRFVWRPEKVVMVFSTWSVSSCACAMLVIKATVVLILSIEVEACTQSRPNPKLEAWTWKPHASFPENPIPLNKGIYQKSECEGPLYCKACIP